MKVLQLLLKTTGTMFCYSIVFIPILVYIPYDAYNRVNLRSKALFHYSQQKFQANISNVKNMTQQILSLQVRTAELSKGNSVNLLRVSFSER